MRWKLLAVDDEQERTEQIADWFDPRHYEVIRAHSGEEGLEKARSLRPDVILLDISMPGMDGQAVLHYLKREPATARIPVVIFTVTADEVEGLRAQMHVGLGKGADYVVAHKWGLAALEQVVMRILSEAGQERIVQRGDYELRLGEGCAEVWSLGNHRRLPPLEARVLEYLFRHAGEPCHPNEIAEAIYEDEGG
ncbi:MAG TPA: response regulator, partial [Anaerolineae bacterium]|nr:response regulator [Anaerolineae bacterium]